MSKLPHLFSINGVTLIHQILRKIYSVYGKKIIEILHFDDFILH